MDAFLLLRACLWVNVAILVPVSNLVLFAKPKRVDKVMGPDTQARRILGCMYCSILLVSLKALTLESTDALKLAIPMFWMQIAYKTLSAVFCIHWNQVIIANQLVTMLQLCTLYALHHEGVQVLF